MPSCSWIRCYASHCHMPPPRKGTRTYECVILCNDLKPYTEPTCSTVCRNKRYFKSISYISIRVHLKCLRPYLYKLFQLPVVITSVCGFVFTEQATRLVPRTCSTLSWQRLALTSLATVTWRRKSTWIRRVTIAPHHRDVVT